MVNVKPLREGVMVMLCNSSFSRILECDESSVNGPADRKTARSSHRRPVHFEGGQWLCMDPSAHLAFRKCVLN